MTKHYDVLIIGAGISGLAAAHCLSSAGYSVTILESQSVPGGRLSAQETVYLEHEGRIWQFPTEHAVHGLWYPYSNFFRWIADIIPDEMLRPAMEEGWIRSRGTEITKTRAGSAIRGGFLPAPFHYLQLFLIPQFWSMIGLSDIVRLPWVLFGLFYALAVDPFNFQESSREARLSDLIRNWGPSIRSFMIGLSRNGLSANPKEIPLSGFLAFLRFYTLRSRKSWRFSYFSDPAGEVFIEPLVAQLKSRLVELHYDTTVSALENLNNNWVATTSREQFVARYAIVATDVQSAQKLLANRQSEETRLSFSESPQSFAPLVLRFWFNMKPNERMEAGIFSGDFILDNFFWLDMIYDSYRAWGAAVGGSVVEAHIYGPADVVSQEDAWIVSMALSEICLVHSELRGRRIHFTLNRLPMSHTLFSIGSEVGHPGTTSEWPNLFIAGDWVRHPHPSLYLERAAVTGIAAANQVLEHEGRPMRPILEPPAPEPFAAGLEKLLTAGGKTISRVRKLIQIKPK